MAFRYAFCNEAFVDWDFARICDYLAEHGYQGVEAAPFTFEQSVFDISAEQRASARQAAANAGLVKSWGCIGFWSGPMGCTSRTPIRPCGKGPLTTCEGSLLSATT